MHQIRAGFSSDLVNPAALGGNVTQAARLLTTFSYDMGETVGGGNAPFSWFDNRRRRRE